MPRERLFERLDEAREQHDGLFVAGPPGAGKTTAVASWLAARRIPGIWFQVDPGDSELPAFFHYLRLAAEPFQRKGGRRLPLLTPEYLGDVEGFSRRFFRGLFACLPPGAMLVLDNYQELPESGALHALLAAALAEVPPGGGFVLVSRLSPPAAYARALANGTLSVLGWDELRLTLEEALAIGRARAASAREAVTGMYTRSEGWAAGFVLLLEGLARGSHEGGDPGQSLHEVFDYFAAQLFERFTPQEQDALVRLSFVPRANASVARALTGSDAAAGLLDALHRRRLFTDRRQAAEPVWQFHALFREFLQARAIARLSPEAHKAHAHRAAAALRGSGQAEEAFPLFVQAGDLAAARAILLEAARRLIAQGRWQGVLEWIGALEDAGLAADCWLAYWRGTARMAIAPLEARTILEACFAAATEANDSLCRMLAAAGIVQTYMLTVTHFRPLDGWIEVLLEEMARGPAFGSAETELIVQSALLVALSYRKPAHPAVPVCVERVFSLLGQVSDLHVRIVAAGHLLTYGCTTGPVSVGSRALPIVDALLERPETGAPTVAWCSFIKSWFYCVRGDLEDAVRAAEHVAEIAEAHGLGYALKLAGIIGAWANLFRCDLPEVDRWLALAKRTIDTAHLYDNAIYHGTMGWRLALGGDAASALGFFDVCIPLVDEAGSAMHRVTYRINLCFALIAAQRFSDARTRMREARDIAAGALMDWQNFSLTLGEASMAIEENDLAAERSAIGAVLEFARRYTAESACVYWQRPWTVRVLARAFELGMEPELVRHLVSTFHLPAPSPASEHWPWPVCIRTLGQYSVELGGQKAEFGRKVPRKPLALLAALVAFGADGVPEKRLIDALWPELDGDGARKAFNIALHRLRTLLGHPRALWSEGGKLTLDRSLCWTDVAAFDRASSSATPAQWQCAVDLYRGAFLPEESEAEWAVSARERYRARLALCVERLGKSFEAEQRWDEAIAIYRKGLEADDLSESFHQGLMRSCLASDRKAEGLSAYRRMKQTLSVVLGISPSRQSEQLHRALLGQ